MTEETPATSPDPELESEGDTDQLPLEDTLEDRGIEDQLDEGYAPPDRPRTHRTGETAWEERHGETLDERLAEEEPEIWQARLAARPGREPDRTGRLLEDDEAVEAGGTDMFAEDVGVDGGAASAEEAAVHFVDDEGEGDDTDVDEGAEDDDEGRGRDDSLEDEDAGDENDEDEDEEHGPRS